jgi:hypothetical protein
MNGVFRNVKPALVAECEECSATVCVVTDDETVNELLNEKNALKEASESSNDSSSIVIDSSDGLAGESWWYELR